MSPIFSRYCPECDCPEVCGGSFCLRDEANDDRGLNMQELKEPAPLEIINRPQFDKEKEFLTEIIR